MGRDSLLRVVADRVKKVPSNADLEDRETNVQPVLWATRDAGTTHEPRSWKGQGEPIQ